MTAMFSFEEVEVVIVLAVELGGEVKSFYGQSCIGEQMQKRTKRENGKE
jgi:hypothetical protein